MPTALIVFGGWEGHYPRQVAEVFRAALAQEGFTVKTTGSLDPLADLPQLLTLDLLVPVWTMGKLNGEQSAGISQAVQQGVGLAGCHGGMCDAFRENSEWQFMTGGQFVAHPGNSLNYTVHITDKTHAITRDIKDFQVTSEQYYLHVDPAIKVLATTRFPTPGADGPHTPNGAVDMPVLWTKLWGQGRVFYSSIGHDDQVVSQEPHLTLMRRGFQWAARSTRKSA
jgi:type 1 glutamine amidotransferase